MKKYIPPQETLTFIAIAVMLMVLSHFFFRDTFKKPEAVTVSIPQTELVELSDAPPQTPMVFSASEWNEIETAFDDPEVVEEEVAEEETPYVDYEGPLEEVPEVERDVKLPAPVQEMAEKIEESKILDESVQEARALPSPEPFVLPDGSKPKIAVIIDDMGMNRKNGFTMIKMQAPITFAFLPYAPQLEDITKAAQDAGHELMIHMPMEPMDAKQDLGSIALRNNMQADDLKEQLDKAYESFDGYVGLNNHMGSRLTQNPTAMNVVMESLKERGLYFVDSKTIGSSVAGKLAWKAGLRTAERDIFLDHENNLGFVRGALRKLENAAKRKGAAIAIGHPKNATVQGLKEWLPTLEAKGFELVPASELVQRADPVTLLVESAPKAMDMPDKVFPASGEGEDINEEGGDAEIMIEAFPLNSISDAPLPEPALQPE